MVNNAIQPGYYYRNIKGVVLDLHDIEQAWDLGRRESDALEYILRARTKENELQDLKKARYNIDRAIQELEERQSLDQKLKAIKNLD